MRSWGSSRARSWPRRTSGCCARISVRQRHRDVTGGRVRMPGDRCAGWPARCRRIRRRSPAASRAGRSRRAPGRGSRPGWSRSTRWMACRGWARPRWLTRAAHLLADDFPDGQLFVGLHAHTPGQRPPTPPRCWPGCWPAPVWVTPGRSRRGWRRGPQLWRGRLAGQEGAASAGRRRRAPPRSSRCCPAAAGCLVLVTSRRRLIALDGAQPLALDTLPPGRGRRAVRPPGPPRPRRPRHRGGRLT